MKRYYHFFATMDNGEKEYLTFDVTQISYLSHNESKGENGETSIFVGVSHFNFAGHNNKSIYDGIRNIMNELETKNE